MYKVEQSIWWIPRVISNVCSDVFKYFTCSIVFYRSSFSCRGTGTPRPRSRCENRIPEPYSFRMSYANTNSRSVLRHSLRYYRRDTDSSVCVRYDIYAFQYSSLQLRRETRPSLLPPNSYLVINTFPHRLIRSPARYTLPPRYDSTQYPRMTFFLTIGKNTLDTIFPLAR